jgi:ABC-type branched-subunit amino acid transport system substrate-binding protein
MSSSGTKCLFLPALALVVATTLAITGCADGVASGAGPKPIKLGSLMAVTGLGLPDRLAAVNAAVRHVNAHGGIRGHRLVLENCDDRNDPNLAQVCARQLVSDGVVATAADISNFSMIDAPILDQAGIPRVGNTALNTEDSTLPTAFPLAGGIVDLMAGGLVGMRRRGLHTLYVATSDTPAGHIIVQLAGQLARAAGMSLAGAAYVPLAATDVTPYVQDAVRSKTDAVFSGLSPALTIQFIVSSRPAGARYVFLVPYGEFKPADISHMGGSAALSENDIEFSTLPPLSAADRFPAIQTFVADMDAEVAAGDAAAGPALRTGGGMIAWLSVYIIARLAEKLATVDAASILHALRTSPTVDTLGLTPPWTPGRTGPAAFPRVTNLFGYLVTQRDGIEILSDPAAIDPFQVLGLGG